jgi:ketosteroid isomerase-like protein
MEVYMETKETLTQNIIALEKKYWQAMVDQDLQTALSLTDFPCVVAGKQGMSSVTQAQFEKMFSSGQGTIKDFKFDENPQVRMLSEDSAVVAYKARSTISKNGMDKAVDAIDTSTWVKRGEKWLCAMHTDIELQN